MLVNLGMGMPVAVADYLRPEVDVFIQSENGVIGVGPLRRLTRPTPIWSTPAAGASRCGPAHPSSIPPGRSP